jgi:hypothetical protein
VSTEKPHLPLVATDKLRVVPDLPNYSLWSLALEKAKDPHFVLSVCKDSISARYAAPQKRLFTTLFY